MRTGRGHTQRLLIVLCVCGVALRLIFLFFARDLDLVRDESHYVYLAITWNRLGFYLDSYRYFWPPGYPFLLATFLQAFDLHALLMLKLG